MSNKAKFHVLLHGRANVEEPTRLVFERLDGRSKESVPDMDRRDRIERAERNAVCCGFSGLADVVLGRGRSIVVGRGGVAAVEAKR